MKITFRLTIISYILLLLFGMPVSADNSSVEEGQNDLIILTDHFPPYTHRNDKGEYFGSAYKKIDAIFKIVGLNYSIQSVPWKRALQQLDQHSNLLIYPLSRNKEREEKFIWIAPLYNLEYKVYGLREKYKDKNIDITSGEYKFICVSTTASCGLLSDMNVPESSLVKVTNIDINQMLNTVNSGHVDFLLLPEVEFRFAAKSLDLNPEKFIALNNYSYIITDYLAANLNLDKVIVEQFKTAIEAQSP